MVSSDIDPDYQAQGRYYILQINRQYTNPSSQQSFQINYGLLAESCDNFPQADTTCWRGDRLWSTVRYGKSPAYWEMFIAVYAHATAFSYSVGKDETASIDGIININVMEGDPDGR